LSPQYVDVDLKIGRSSVGVAGVVGFFVGAVVGHQYLLNVQELILSVVMKRGTDPAVGSGEG
jgi:hypothetical protein